MLISVNRCFGQGAVPRIYKTGGKTSFQVAGAYLFELRVAC
jgi:hypothetical protein